MKHIYQVTVEPHDFRPHDFVGGDPALDLANTVAGWNAAPRDWLDGFPRLADWAVKAGLIAQKSATRLARAAGASEREAARAFADAIELREIIHEYFVAIAEGRTPDSATTDALHSAYRKAEKAHRAIVDDGRLKLDLDESQSRFSLVSDAAAMAAFNLARTIDAGRLKVCDGDDCGWLFIDRSKAGRRRWCDMATCGNAEKSHRFQKRAMKRR